MSFGIAIPPAPAATAVEEFKARVEQHRQYGNEPTTLVLDAVAVLVSGLASKYPDREIMVEECQGHFGDPEFPDDEGYVNLKVKVRAKNRTDA